MTYAVIVKIDVNGVIEARANFADAPFLQRIGPAIERFDAAIRRLERNAAKSAQHVALSGD
jgi:hypothetical protein